MWRAPLTGPHGLNVRGQASVPVQTSVPVQASRIADILLSHAHIAVEAAVNGAGAALVHPALVARELKLGRLRRLSFQTLHVEQSYWMARPSKRKPTNQSKKIMNWLRSRTTEERDWLDRHQHA